ncbi:hypothetical protein APK116_05 [Acinetobacter phage vB_AbaP_APK116]|uniref:Uncharacterized protein n=1 Tax=Acinetobacter phage vB_AbaP_APK116 TaxID=2686438 RepID=A0A6M3BJ30_9CAUD|nr:hypothetical protein APK116_05 [Acinetobacter phage vB_AbaP_APK116]
MVKQTNTTFVEVDFAFDTDTRNKVGFWKFPEESEETDHHKATTTTQFSGEMTNYIETKGAALCFSIWVLPIADKWKAIILFYFILAIPMFAWLANKYT